ncbi:MAG: phosphoglycerate dehydrogenase [Ignavibacteriales bacterium CG_4_9_14_3_um_filter_34_10]|nr:MAG: phosphoglycerate dehydrogenase [Ignavibacteriales bacterium CG_4_9_14_3_um_filter_34_10]
MKIKVLIADKFPEIYIKKIIDSGIEVIYEPKLGENDLPNSIKDIECLVVRSTVVNEATIQNSNKLNLIIRAGAGVNNINISAANKKGIYVSNCPGKNSIAVAELAIGLMLALDRRIPHNVADFKSGKWNKSEYSKSQGIFGKTLAIVGYGAIGKEVAKRALALGMKIYAKDIFKIEDPGINEFSEFEQILPIADVITLHLPQTQETKNLFNDKMFALLKPGAILINTSRPGVIDEDALIKAVNDKGIKVGLDVFKDEPEGKSGNVSSKLQSVENIYVTHHIGASTEQAQNAVAEETVNIILQYINSGVIAHWINHAKVTDVKYQLIVKHFDKPGVLASILDVLKSGNINVEEVENVIFEGGMVACCTMKLQSSASAEMIEEIQRNPNVISYSHTSLN